MSKIYCILGKSATGKDTLLNLMVDKGFKRVVSHTSRKKRSNEILDKDYHFVSKEQMLQMIGNHEFVETRSYSTVTNDIFSWKEVLFRILGVSKEKKSNEDMWYYGVHKNEIDLDSDNNYICIVDGNGFKALREHFGSNNVIGIYLWVNNRERLLRALNRCELDDKGVDEIVRRYIDDDIKFTKDITNHCILKINNTNINNTLNIVLRNIRNGM